MIVYAKHESFFLNHLYEQVRAKYDLSDEQMDTLIGMLGRFHDDDIKKSLLGMRKKENQSSIQKFIDDHLAEDARTRYNQVPMGPSDPFAVPVGIPLSKEMIKSPFVMY